MQTWVSWLKQNRTTWRPRNSFIATVFKFSFCIQIGFEIVRNKIVAFPFYSAAAGIRHTLGNSDRNALFSSKQDENVSNEMLATFLHASIRLDTAQWHDSRTFSKSNLLFPISSLIYGKCASSRFLDSNGCWKDLHMQEISSSRWTSLSSSTLYESLFWKCKEALYLKFNKSSKFVWR